MRVSVDAPQPRTAPNFVVPSNACDCHVHVVAPTSIFPQSADRPYSYPPADVEALQRMLSALRLDRVVLVQPLVYRGDHSFLIEALKQLGPRARGTAVIDSNIAESELALLHSAGVRGARIMLHSPSACARLAPTAERIRHLGWRLHMYGLCQTLHELRPQLEVIPIPLVFDHFGGASAALGPNSPGFSTVLDLARSGKAYVKLSGLDQCSKLPPDYPDVPPILHALLEAAPDQIIWGNNWPHPHATIKDSAQHDPSRVIPWEQIDDGHELNLLAGWISDQNILKKVLVDNPARLFDF